MSSGSTRYTARFQLPELLERGRAELIFCPIYRDGAAVAPSAGTITITDSRGVAVVSAAAVTITGSIAQYSVADGVTSALDFGDGWAFVWALTMPDGVVHKFRNNGALVAFRLYPTITDADIARRVSGLDTSSATALTSATNYQNSIDEADVEVQLRLLERGRRPWLIASPSALRMVWLTLAVAIIIEDLATRNDEYVEAAARWRTRYESAWASATLLLDYDQDGQADSANERVAARDPVIWLC